MLEKNKRLLVSLVVLGLVGVAVGMNESNLSRELQPKPIRDGFVLFGVDGVVENVEGDYFFVPDQDLIDAGAKIARGSRVPVLLCSGLDKVVTAMGNAKRQSVRLWGSIVSFKKENFIYVSYSLPIIQRSASLQSTSEKESTPPQSSPKSEVLPDDVLKKLHPEKFVNIKQLRSSMLKEQDVIIANRIGFIKMDKEHNYVLTFDAFGQNISNVSFKLLKCHVLEQVINMKGHNVSPIRVRVVGVVTQFRGDHFMLLQKISPVFSNGNFSN